MSFIHGKNTVMKVNAKDLSPYTNTSQLEVNADSHDVTTYGKNSHVFQGGLKGGAASMGGVYDSTAVSGPRAALKPLVGTVVPLIRQPEGTGSGKPQDSVDVLILKYVETAPVADMVTWSCDMQLSDDVDDTPQAA